MTKTPCRCGSGLDWCDPAAVVQCDRRLARDRLTLLERLSAELGCEDPLSHQQHARLLDSIHALELAARRPTKHHGDGPRDEAAELESRARSHALELVRVVDELVTKIAAGQLMIDLSPARKVLGEIRGGTASGTVTYLRRPPPFETG